MSPDEALVASMVETVSDYAILMLDPAGRVASWNKGAERFKGWKAEEIIGRHFSIFYPDEDVAAGKLEMELNVAVREGRFEDEGWRVRKDGSRFWANVVITAVRDDAGDLLGYGKVTRDVTERYLAEQALRASEARFRSVTESATDAIITAGPDGRIVSWNPAAERLYGWIEVEVIGRSLTILVPERHREQTRAMMIEVGTRPPSSDQTVVPTELVAAHKDGSEIPVEASIASWVLDGHRNFTGIVRDISERKRVEVQLQHLADHDPLTDLLNRRRFEIELKRIVSEASRYHRDGALLILDLDGFKQVNDRYGHPAGDEIITKVGALLTDLVRESDIVARLGGDEFGIVLPEANAVQAERVAGKIVDAVRSQAFLGAAIHGRVTASVGITPIDGDNPVIGQRLLIEADRAMYDAKAQGRNGHAFRTHVRKPDAGADVATVVGDAADLSPESGPGRGRWGRL